MTKKILITGSCGFIFSNYMRKMTAERFEYEFVSVDKLIADFNHRNIFQHKNHKFYVGDVADEQFMNNLFKIERPDLVIHGAAESFVDDSIRKALPFVHSNVLGTQVMVDMSVQYGVERFLYVSTDEVYGQLQAGDVSWTEASPLNPRNPYSASKAAGELIVRAASQTHGLKYNITRSCNNYGPRQPPRNLVPKVITQTMRDQKIPIHGDGSQFREWLYVDDHCTAVMDVLEKAPANETYNVGSGVELNNLDIARKICAVMEKKTKFAFVKDRPGHDFRYSVDCAKLHKLGWKPKNNFDTAMAKCVEWYLDNPWYFDVQG